MAFPRVSYSALIAHRRAHSGAVLRGMGNSPLGWLFLAQFRSFHMTPVTLDNVTYRSSESDAE
jgi:hypothetical protein